MLTLTDQIFLTLCLPLDSKLMNVIQDGSNVVVETLSDYLIRVDKDSRHLGMEIDFLSPSGIYDINNFVSLLENGGIINTRYRFKLKTSDDGLVEIIDNTGGGSATIDGHIVRNDTSVLTQRPNITFKSSLSAVDNPSNNSTDIDVIVDEEFDINSINPIANSIVSTKFLEQEELNNGIDDRLVNLEGSQVIVDSSLSTTSENAVQNKVITERLDQIISAITEPPTYIQPSASITNVTQTIETGSNLGGTISITFTQNDAGLANSYELFKDSVSVSTTQNTPYTLTNIQSNIVYYGRVCYNEGNTKNNNLDIPDTTGKILPGCINSSTRVITPVLKCFYGAVNTIPTTSANIRALVGNVFSTSSSFTLSTGIVYRNFVVAIPVTKSITKVIDSTNLGADITSKYVLTNNNFQVDDAGGIAHSYKLYVMTTDIPFSPTASHVITIA